MDQNVVVKHKMAMSAEKLNQVVKLKDKENYQIWKFQIDIILKAYGLHGIVIGTHKLAETATNAEKEEWTKNYAKAQSAIVTTIGQSSLTYILNCKTSYEMFEIYEGDVEQRKATLLQEFFNYTFKKKDMEIHTSDLENIAFKLKAIKSEVDDTMLMSKILSSLLENYKYLSAPGSQHQ